MDVQHVGSVVQEVFLDVARVLHPCQERSGWVLPIEASTARGE